jgi:2-polyprenyl-3-methyl-5-hydroxy-6-metoxy-1,4-benzoquinol methylase
MKLAEFLLYSISRRWSSPIKQRADLGKINNAVEYNLNYALKLQYDSRLKNGLNYEIRNKSILEIGCGHGGISVFLAVNGARSVTGIDLNVTNLGYAELFKTKIEQGLGIVKELPVVFKEMNAYEMQFPDESFDVVIADNVFEHFMEPQKVLEQSFKVLKKGGLLIVPKFSSILSKHALHLKNGLKVPWANIFFSEKTICNVMVRLAKDNPVLLEYYPGIADSPVKVRDLRKYKDLNDITYSSFKKMAKQTGFDIQTFTVAATPYLAGKLVQRLPGISRSRLVDIFSLYASAVLRKSK